MKQAGQIPDLAPDDHGEFWTSGIGLEDHIKYPLTQTIYLTKTNDASWYSYDFVKDNMASEWRLTGAQRVRTDGQSENLSVK